MKIYLAGPMRGYKLYNFPAFAEASRVLRLLGHEVISPAEMDLAKGFDPSLPIDHPDQIPFDMASVLKEDFEAILSECEAIVLLPGWSGSAGAKAEMVVGYYSGKRIYTYHTPLIHKLLRYTGKPTIEFGRVDRLWDNLPGVKQLRLSLVDVNMPPDGTATVHVDVVDSETSEQVYDFGPLELENGGQHILLKLDAEVEVTP